MPNYTSLIEAKGSVSLFKSDVLADESVLQDNPGSSYVAAFYNNRYIDLFFLTNNTSRFPSGLQPVPSSWWANQRSPIAAEVKSGENNITVFFRTNRQINTTSQPWEEHAVQIVRFSIDTGIETGRYSFLTKQFENISPRGLEWFDDQYTTEYITGNTAAFDKEYGSYGVTASGISKDYKDALSEFSWVLNPSDSTGNSKSSKVSSILSATSDIDKLTGKKNVKDTFNFSTNPNIGDQFDSITNFSAKDKDTLQFSKSAFGLTTGKFAIAKTQKKLDKLLATDVNIVYFKPKGELIFNANGPEAGFGVDGGVFAQLVGAPTLKGSLVSFT